MKSLSLGKATQDATFFLKRESGLVIPIALLFIGIPVALLLQAIPPALRHIVPG